MTENYKENNNWTGGWAGKILWVDLSKGEITTVPTSKYEPEKYIGGVGINSKIFWDMGCPDVEAYHPDNPLIISNGPAAGASGPFTRATICSIAPAAYPEELFTYSGFGGKFPTELKYAGYDGIVIIGKAENPVYLSIEDGEVALKDAADLWGMDTFTVQEELIARYPKSSVLTIGPAGENLSRVAIIITETSGAAGQGGYGAVMGSKNLKAIVTRGTGTLKIARPDDFMELIQERKDAGEWVIGPFVEWGRYPQKSEDMKNRMKDKYLKNFTGCFACPFQCHGQYNVPGIGKGTQMCNDNWYQYSAGDDKMGESLEGMWEGNLLSQKLGLNNFDLVGFMLLFYRFIKEKKILTKEDFGLDKIPALDNRKLPEFGTPEDHHEFLEKFLGGIADGSSPFHQGAARAAESFGPEAVELYKSVFPAWGNRSHHIRGVAEALHWATDTRDPFNSCHDYVSGFGQSKKIGDWFGVPGGYLEGEAEGKHKNIYDGAEDETIWVQHNQCLKNSLHICEYASFPSSFFHPPEMDIRVFESRLLTAITGLDYSVDELWKAGERIWNLRRAIMVVRENRLKNDDAIYPGMFDEVFRVQSPELLSAPLDRDQWESMRNRYYEKRGWNVETGQPKREKLAELGLDFVADKLESMDRLG